MRINCLLAAIVISIAAPAVSETISEQVWEPVALNEEEVVAKGDTFIQFDRDGTFFGKDGCNSIRGRFVTNGEAILLGPAAATMMACPQPIMGQAKAFTDALMAARMFNLDSAKLVLLDADGKTLVAFTVKDPQ